MRKGKEIERKQDVFQHVSRINEMPVKKTEQNY